MPYDQEQENRRLGGTLQIDEGGFALLLDELNDTGLVKVTGSYADGTQRDHSDLDLWVKRDREGTPPTDRNMRKLITILERHGLKWGSIVTGHICVSRLPIDLELSQHFTIRKGRLKRVVVCGVEFETR